jgi:mannan endo-1,4-beta-mannosidase
MADPRPEASAGEPTPEPAGDVPKRAYRRRLLVVAAAVLVVVIGVAAAAAGGVIHKPVLGVPPGGAGAAGTGGANPVYAQLPIQVASYLGVYQADSPESYAPSIEFSRKINHRLNLAVYYSGWREPFQFAFAGAAAKHDAIPLVQIDPYNTSLAKIAAGDYDTYLTTFAQAVHTWRKNIIISFGHEMNGNWYSWGWKHTNPKVFVSAWRHIVDVFRAEGDYNVTWLWAVNIIDEQTPKIPSPAPWWPGSRYVTWVGIDGYYLKPSWTFAPLFGPTIAAVHLLAGQTPIIISETAASANQAAKITNLFSGIRQYSLLGFVWFDVNGKQDWHISSRSSEAAFASGARHFDEVKP